MGTPPLVSIVTPFYNTGQFLTECIESVLHQTYENWEYILVDNCSTDQGTAIAKEYATRFPQKLRYVRTESFLSQVQNYNFALSCVSEKSAYCKIVQADDWIFPDCIRSMVELAEAHPAVGIVAAYELEDSDVRLGGLPYPSPEVSGRDIGRFYFLKRRYLFGTPTSLLMRATAVRSRHPFYEERYAPFEDGHACLDLLKHWNFGFVHQVLTYSRRQEDSIISPLRDYGLEPFLHLSMLVVHGRNYLSEAEYVQCLKLTERNYYQYLARVTCTVRSRNREIWEFHKKGLDSIDYLFKRSTLLKWLPRAFIEKSLNKVCAILG